MFFAQSTSVAPTNLSANGISLSQTPGGAVAFTLNGAAVTSGVATMGAAQKITVASAGVDTARTFTITGTDANAGAQTEALTGASAATATSTKYFKTVTSITTDAATAGAITAGFTVVSISPTVTCTKLRDILSIGCAVSATITYGLDYTFDNSVWITHATITGKSAAFNDTIIYPVRGVRLTVSASTSGSVTGQMLCWDAI